MQHSDGRFKGHDGLDLYYQFWMPEEKPKAILLVVHGFGEHGGRYGNLVDYFLPRGYGICTYDLRGHGKSEGIRGYTDRFSDFVNDLDIFRELVQSRHQNVPLFLIGHSTGGTIAAAYSVSHQNGFRGLVLSGALLSPPADVPAVTIFAARLLSRFAPRTGLYKLDADAVSSDKGVVDAYVHDPLVYQGKVRARMGVELMDAMAMIRRRVSEIRLPVLIMHGDADRLSDPEGSQTVYNGAGSADKTLKLYTGFYHEIFNEPGRQQVFADMDEWLVAHIKGL
ncbi:MAG: lysophospholipase [Dehalococcoidales bacterium]|nr:lysophospholipase [Dehalococcoidales bacterium]